MKYLPSEIEINGVTYYSGLELASKQLDWYNLGLAAGKSESYAKGWNNGYATASIKYFDEYSVKLEEKYNSGYEAGKKANGISKKEIPGEYLSHIEEARLEGYKEGYSDAKEGGYAEGYSDDYCKECKEEPGRDDDDGEPIDDNQSEYDKGYYAGWEDGKNHIMQYI